VRPARSLLPDELGATTAEHALMLALVALCTLGAWAALGERTAARVRCAADAVAGIATPCTSAAGREADPRRTEPGIDAVSEAIGELPAAVRDALARQGTEIVVTGRSVAEAMPERLASRRARGWPRGTTFADVQAVYLPSGNRVIVARDALGSRFSEALAHEIGHAIDLGRGRSSAGAFRAAVDRTQWTERDDYYTQPGRAGPEEAYAESLALYATDPEALRRDAPALYRYWQAHAGDELGTRSPALLATAGAAPRPFDYDAGLVEDTIGDVADALKEASGYTPMGAAVERGPALVDHATRAAWTQTPLGDTAHATWNGLPPPARTGLVASAGFVAGLAELARPTIGDGLRYAPSPRGLLNFSAMGMGAITHPTDVWASARAMPAAMVTHYEDLGHDLVSGDPYTAFRAAGMLTGEIATLFVPGNRIAGRSTSAARVAASVDARPPPPLRRPPPVEPPQPRVSPPLPDLWQARANLRARYSTLEDARRFWGDDAGAAIWSKLGEHVPGLRRRVVADPTIAPWASHPAFPRAVARARAVPGGLTPDNLSTALGDELGTVTVYRGLPLTDEQVAGVRSGGLRPGAFRNKLPPDADEMFSGMIARRLLSRETTAPGAFPEKASMFSSVTDYPDLAGAVASCYFREDTTTYVLELAVPRNRIVSLGALPGGADGGLLPYPGKWSESAGFDVHDKTGAEVRVSTYGVDHRLESFLFGPVAPEEIRAIRPIGLHDYTWYPRLDPE